jgi:hypothetical protein
MRNNAMSLSFGYLTNKSRKRNDGITELIELDLFEISIVAAPANADTRIIDMKALGGGGQYGAWVPLDWVDFNEDELKSLSPDALREKAEQVAREHAPVVVATFEC